MRAATVRESAVLPDQLLSHRPAACGARLHARHGTQELPRKCGRPGDWPARVRKRPDTALRRQRTVGESVGATPSRKIYCCY